MDIKELILLGTKTQAFFHMPPQSLELSFGFITNRDMERPLPEIIETLDKWCVENGLRYSYNHGRSAYVFACLDQEVKATAIFPICPS